MSLNNLNDLDFSRCRVCFEYDKFFEFQSLFDGDQEIRRLILNNFGISYHMYMYDKHKVLICESCANSAREAQTSPKLFIKFKKKVLKCEKLFKTMEGCTLTDEEIEAMRKNSLNAQNLLFTKDLLSFESKESKLKVIAKDQTLKTQIKKDKKNDLDGRNSKPKKIKAILKIVSSRRNIKFPKRFDDFDYGVILSNKHKVT